MKRLIIMQYGHCLNNGALDDEGKRQINKMARILKDGIRNQSVLVMSSNAVASIESAEIITQILGVESEQHDVLSGERKPLPKDNKDILELVDKKGENNDIIILIFSHEYVRNFPVYFGAVKWGRKWEGELNREPLRGGEYSEIDCEKGSLWYTTRNYCYFP